MWPNNAENIYSVHNPYPAIQGMTEYMHGLQTRWQPDYAPGHDPAEI